MTAAGARVFGRVAASAIHPPPNRRAPRLRVAATRSRRRRDGRLQVFRRAATALSAGPTQRRLRARPFDAHRRLPPATALRRPPPSARPCAGRRASRRLQQLWRPRRPPWLLRHPPDSVRLAHESSVTQRTEPSVPNGRELRHIWREPRPPGSVRRRSSAVRSNTPILRPSPGWALLRHDPAALAPTRRGSDGCSRLPPNGLQPSQPPSELRIRVGRVASPTIRDETPGGARSGCVTDDS